MNTRLRYLAVCCLVSVVGCERPKPPPQVGQPPIEFSFRKSQVPTKGMVVGIRNISQDETLTKFVVKVSGPDEQNTRSHVVDAPVSPQDTITIGWVELDGWELKPDDEVSVTCEQYTGAATTVVPKP
jgi:hypothetical protein